MSDLRTAAQQALEALLDDCLVQVGPHSWERRSDLAITALRAALAEPVQEAVAFAHINGTSDTKWHPPQRKPLTEEEIDSIWDSEKAFADIYAIARAIERAHGIV